MRWQGGRRSSNVEDRRGSGLGRPLALGGGAASIVVALLVLLLGGDPSELGLGGGEDPRSVDGTGGSGQPLDPRQEELKDFVSVVLADTEDTWPEVLAPVGVQYAQPRLVLFTDAVQSACGFQESAVGPFYCPPDRRVYLDLGFFDELDRRFGAPGDFAQAYVVAHEVGHHVQNLLGISRQVQSLRGRLSPEEANALSVLQELQADCFAGIWAHHAQRQRQLLESGDVEEGLAAASAIGDDTLQRRAQGYVVPESFTHGSSEQRVTWFRRGLKQGTLDACDTFGDAGVGAR
ncbi:neutral zinc metallopeptidase [Myxococcus xanthus]|uniref:Flagellar biosynthesis protein FlgM n=1 Tax=Myxococcus xanthus TaxID=34 RepID=A0AAE6G3R5_MYXXA|nr:neutral zinc metallopeptidase [Myxococcus xanthus]QDE70391.1 flagellar biosynthesis protein FlgM [Myxococcus xanthus]QDE77670.1 flagellar biosynthesis protein FlgM [Myxococcus xanthus]QDE85057.1 flagellar biosynthesis protein FlgM [Myxococcus xanthus]QDE99212.1 flagellar biosynthesis protein FlgM [Myxococcus xanthus]QDF06907.1 flagellar biosynthesis protein FlgM [Myxococcus xanthus]